MQMDIDSQSKLSNLTNKHLDYIIVGQGLAGSVLSFLLEQQGYSILVIDKGHQHAASNAAAGLINPITGRYYTKSWKIEELIDSARMIYGEIEQHLGCKLWYDIDIYRALHSIEQVNDWALRSLNPDYKDFAADAPNDHVYRGVVNDSEGTALIKGGARVDIGLFIEQYRSYLIESELLLETGFDYSQLALSTDTVNYGSVSADHLIFSEGYQMLNNPYFNYLPLAPAKGESLHIKIKDVEIPHNVMKHQQYLVPIGNEQFWSGGGFAWKYQDSAPTKAFIEKYVKDLGQFINHPISIVEHRAGVRPCVKDRKPLIGTHPEHPRLHIFNGLGTKGTSLAPFFAKQFVEYLTGNGDLLPVVDITRFS